jgi:transposase
MTKIAKIRRMFDKGMTTQEIVAKGFSTSQVYAEFKRREAGEPVKSRGRPKQTTETVEIKVDKKEFLKPKTLFIQPKYLEKAKALIAATYEQKSDPVNPDHYKVGGIETADYIDAKKLGYNLGNVIKYVSRANHKGYPLEDLQKAKWYLERQIAQLETSQPQKDDWA